VAALHFVSCLHLLVFEACLAASIENYSILNIFGY